MRLGRKALFPSWLLCGKLLNLSVAHAGYSWRQDAASNADISRAGLTTTSSVTAVSCVQLENSG